MGWRKVQTICAMLKTAEAGMEKNKTLLMVNKTTSFKKGKSKKNSTGAGTTVFQKKNKGGATKGDRMFLLKTEGSVEA